ncbi:hypothetical protein [Streptomyces sulfonofaciens]|uniref:hypothetical protein n=1 Tax=Streptomyces sulfonofaciens TaxID=68272 RepID=UPI00167A078E|nr:hypothetical protein [Streptomyces sulfonofaciens]
MPHLVGSGDPALLARLAVELAADPEVTVRGQHGPAGAPTLLLVDMTADRAELLRRSNPAATVEIDAPLEPYANRGPR